MKVLKWIWNELRWCIEYVFFLKEYFNNKNDRKIIMFGTPVHSNIGDAAIVMAEVEFIKKNTNFYYIEVYGRSVRRHSKPFQYVIEKKDVIALTGGGFLGSLWAIEEEMCRNIVKMYLQNPIIIFPQSIYFSQSEEGRKELKKSQFIYNQHKNITFCLREEYSYQYFKEQFPLLKSIFLPDMVLSLKPEINLIKNRAGILTCFRADCECVLSDVERDYIRRILIKYYDMDEIKNTSTMHNKNITRRIRKKIVFEKIQEFANAEIVITDRLHGMIFAAITGTPCIALDNISNKVKGTYKWLDSLEYICYVENIKDIEKIIEKFIYNNKYLYNFSNGNYQQLKNILERL